MDRNDGEWVRRMQADLRDGYDEELELEWEEHRLDHVLKSEADAAAEARDRAARKLYSTHGGAFAIGPAAASVPGSLFSGPQQIERRVAQWGPAEFDRRLAHALSAFIAAMQAHCIVDHRDDAEGTVAAWRAIQQGSVDASTLLIARPYPPLDR